MRSDAGRKPYRKGIKKPSSTKAEKGKINFL
jgi:hypothetical protein